MTDWLQELAAKRVAENRRLAVEANAKNPPSRQVLRARARKALKGRKVTRIRGGR